MAAAVLVSFLAPVMSASAQVTQDSTRRDSTVQRMERIVVTGARSPATVGGAAAVVVAPSALNVTPGANGAGGSFE